MKLMNELNKDLKQAMKDKNKDKLSMIRMLKTNLTNEKIKLGYDLSDDEEIVIVNREIKQHKDSIEQFAKGKRDDLVKQQEKELAILKEYAPKQLSFDDIKKVVNEKATQLNATTKQDFGKLMGSVMKELKGKADGNDVKKAVSEQLK